jgi:hypothetical protein
MVMAPKWVAPMATTLETRNQAHTTAKSNLREDHCRKTCLRRYASMRTSIYTEGRGFSNLLRSRDRRPGASRPRAGKEVQEAKAKNFFADMDALLKES